jgi:hypothetical protein
LPAPPYKSVRVGATGANERKRELRLALGQCDGRAISVDHVITEHRLDALLHETSELEHDVLAGLGGLVEVQGERP